MVKNIEIRQAVDADSEALSALVCDVLHASNLADYGLENIRRVAGHFTVPGVRHMINDGRVTYVAEYQGRIVGTASVDFADDGQRAAVKTFFVDANLQRAGIGAHLFERLKTCAAENGVTQFTLRASLTAIKFYENMGFVAVRDHWEGTERTVEMHN